MERKSKDGSKQKKRVAKPAEYILLIAAAAVVVAIAVITARLFREETGSFTTSAPLYQYYGFEKTEYNGGSRIDISDEGQIMLENDEGSAVLDGTPLYYGNQSRVVVLSDMVHMPREGAPALVYCFGEALIRAEKTYVINNGGEIEVDGGFLFNGSDLYVFLEPVTLTIGTQEYELTPLSYAFVQYNRDAQYFDRDSQTDFYTQTNADIPVRAAFADGRTLDLNTDILYGVDGSWQLLINTPSAAKPLT